MNLEYTKAPLERIGWVDVCKGVCILLVVYGHVVGGLQASSIVLPKSGFSWWRDWVYLFHMPAFFFLSGLLAARSLGTPARLYFVRKVQTLVYPYVLWTGILVGAQLLMAKWANSPADLSRAARFIYEPYGYGLWFLYALLLISVLHFGLVRVRLPAPVICVIACAAFVAASLGVCSFWPILNTALAYWIYYSLGTVSVRFLARPPTLASRSRLLCIGLAGFVAMTVALTQGWTGGMAAGFLVAISGIAAVVSVSLLLAAGLAGRPWALLGRYSIEIYLGHALFSTATRPILTKLGVTYAFIFVTLGVVIGITASIAIAKSLDFLRFPYLYQWPRSKQEGATAAVRAHPIEVAQP